MDQRMVEGCIEANVIVVAPAGDLDPLEALLPDRRCGVARLVEWKLLGVQVGSRLFDAHPG